MQKILFPLLFIISEFVTYPQIKVNIIVYAKNVLDTQKVYITGNTNELGLWNPGLIKLDKMNDSIWTKSFIFKKNVNLEFKFTKGDWINEALTESKLIPQNYQLVLNCDTTLYFKITNWKNGEKKTYGQITGNVKYHTNFSGKNILPRNIIVWLPPSYDSAIDKRYPVLYMQDGQNIIDPKTSAFGLDWQMDEILDSLIRKNIVKEIILVGIYNSKNRTEEYSNTQSGYSYLKFIINELKPFIDRTYRTLPENKNTAIAGSSMGGLISLMMVLEFPNIFSKAACLSPAFKIEKIDYVAPTRNSQLKIEEEIKIYIDNGGIGLENDLQPGIDEMLEVLKSKGFVENKNLLWIKDFNSEHNENAWSKRAHRFLEFLFPIIEMN